MTDPDRAAIIFVTAKVIADGIGAMFGPDCEIVVHDLRDPTHSLVHIVNGHVTGRRLGHPIGDLSYAVLPHIGDRDVLANYAMRLADGRVLKSTTCLIRDGDGEPLAALCINYDVSRLAMLNGALNSFLNAVDVEEESDDATPPPGDGEILGILRVLVRNTVKQFGQNPKTLRREERLQAIEFLESKGAFLIKGSVPMVAEQLGVSEPSVYRYIDQVRNKR